MVRVLCVHGVGHQDVNQGWHQQWTDAITAQIHFWSSAAQVQVDFADYDSLFARTALTPMDIARALGKLLEGGLLPHMREFMVQPRGLADITEEVRWTAGMVVQWVEDDRLRAATRRAILDDLNRYQPDVIMGHSLGSLICYDTFVETPEAIRRKTFITFGSQLGNHFVKGQFAAGRIEPLASAAFWYHLYNPRDHVFTAPLTLAADNFAQVDATFGSFWGVNHDALRYLNLDSVRDQVFRDLAGAPVTRAMTRGARAFARFAEPPTRRALLVGINDYPDAANRLEGCVNDVFLMSAALQESGFTPEDIRVVLDARATAPGILERLHWLLDGVNAGDQRFFFYSGHGAQLPVYGPDGKVERIEACLVPYDFNWSRQTAITDDALVDFYSQLPYEARFMIVLDSCYSGGMTRAGGARVRGLDPPDDIRHRLLRWDAQHEMWVPRELPPANADIAAADYGELYAGESGATHRLGRAMALRTLPNRRYDRTRKQQRHSGPYLPIIYEACKEQELAYEYRHGVTSYGAFTYSLSTILRQTRARGRAATFEQLLRGATNTLKELHYDQHPVMLGPKKLLGQPIPWQRPAGGRKR